MEQLAREVDREHVNDMVAGTPSTPAGVGLAIRERLSLRWRTITEVRVEMDDVAVSITG